MEVASGDGGGGGGGGSDRRWWRTRHPARVRRRYKGKGRDREEAKRGSYLRRIDGRGMFRATVGRGGEVEGHEVGRLFGVGE